jgi:DNA-binding protein YbaB
MSERLADIVLNRLHDQRELVAAVDDHCRAISVTVASRDGTVSVDVDGLGSVTGLRLSASAYRHGGDALGSLIVDTAHAAAKVSLDLQQELLAELNVRLAELRRTPTTDAVVEQMTRRVSTS